MEEIKIDSLVKSLSFKEVLRWKKSRLILS